MEAAAESTAGVATPPSHRVFACGHGSTPSRGGSARVLNVSELDPLVPFPRQITLSLRSTQAGLAGRAARRASHSFSEVAGASHREGRRGAIATCGDLTTIRSLPRF